MDRILETIANYLNKLISRDTYDNSIDIAPSVGITKEEGFFLYVGVAGRVVGTTYAGNSVDRTFITGYHKVKMKFVDTSSNGTAATNMAACF